MKKKLKAFLNILTIMLLTVFVFICTHNFQANATEKYITEDGLSYTIVEEGTEEAYAYITGCDTSICEEITIPEKIVGIPVTTISSQAFRKCSGITKIKIPNSINSIGFAAFEDCSSLTEIVIPDGVDSLGDYMFQNCSSLVKISIPDSVTYLNSAIFSGCSALKEIKIPNNVTVIPYSAFSGCSSLTNITLHANIKFVHDGAFSDCSSLTDIIFLNPDTQIAPNDEFSDIGLTIPTNATIHGYSNSTAKIFADKYGHKFVALDEYNPHTHSYISKVTKAATCTATGKKTYTCSCGDSYTKTIAKKSHTYKSVTTKATLTKNGKVENKCSVCGYVASKSTTVYYPKTIKLSKTEYTYNGKAQTPSVTVKDSKGNTLKKDTDYTVKYESGRKLPGKYTVTVTFKGKYSGTKKLTYTIAPRVTSKVTATQTTTTITLKWNKVTGAEGYRIYQYNTKTKKYEKVKDVTGTTLKISKLKAGTKYKFKVRAFTKDDGTIMGAYSPIFETATKAKTPTLKVTSTKKGTAALSWTNVTGESGYQVYYATSKNGEYKKLNSYKVNVVKGSKSKLTSGKTYYFKVRAYTKTDNGTVYSAWSTVKSIKIK